MHMLKRHTLKLLLGLAIVAVLLAGVAFGSGATAAKAAPAQHLLACAKMYPSCV
jgi:hypothetical protein